jgi:ribonuclease-3
MTPNEAKVAACESIINYEFQNKLLCLEALQASGHMLRWQHNLIRVGKNDRLAVLGDAAVKAYLCRRWFDSGRSKGGNTRILIFDSADLVQGQWTQAERALLANTNLSVVGYTHGLRDCVILNQGTLSVSDKTMATTIEAIHGAVLIDGGAGALSAVLVTLGLTHPFLEAVTFIFLTPLRTRFHPSLYAN